MIGVTLENDRFDVDIEQEILDHANLKYFKGKSGRKDAKSRKLKFKGIMSDDMQIPFFGTKYVMMDSSYLLVKA